MEPVFATIVDHVIPPSVDRPILYPVIAEPPLLLGVVHDRLICDDDTAVAVRPVGGCVVVDVGGIVIGGGIVVPTKEERSERYRLK